MSLHRLNLDIESLDIAYLLGIYLTDGYVTKESVRLRVIDEDIAQTFADIGKRLFGKAPKLSKYKNKSNNGYKNQDFYEVHIYSIRLGRWLEKVTDTKNKLPAFVYKMSDEWKKEFICGIIDGDGWCSIGERRRNNNPTGKLSWWATIGFAGKKDTYIEEMRKFLSIMGIDYSFTDRITKHGIPMREFRFKTSSFIDNGLYFKCQRKQKRVEIIRKEKIGQKYNTKPLSLTTFND